MVQEKCISEMRENWFELHEDFSRQQLFGILRWFVFGLTFNIRRQVMASCLWIFIFLWTCDRLLIRRLSFSLIFTYRQLISCAFCYAVSRHFCKKFWEKKNNHQLVTSECKNKRNNNLKMESTKWINIHLTESHVQWISLPF